MRRDGVRTGLAVDSEALEELTAERRATRLSDDMAGDGRAVRGLGGVGGGGGEEGEDRCGDEEKSELRREI